MTSENESSSAPKLEETPRRRASLPSRTSQITEHKMRKSEAPTASRWATRMAKKPHPMPVTVTRLGIILSNFESSLGREDMLRRNLSFIIIDPDRDCKPMRPGDNP